jgi:hypothetical protein
VAGADESILPLRVPPVDVVDMDYVASRALSTQYAEWFNFLNAYRLPELYRKYGTVPSGEQSIISDEDLDVMLRSGVFRRLSRQQARIWSRVFAVAEPLKLRRRSILWPKWLSDYLPRLPFKSCINDVADKLYIGSDSTPYYAFRSGKDTVGITRAPMGAFWLDFIPYSFPIFGKVLSKAQEHFFFFQEKRMALDFADIEAFLAALLANDCRLSYVVARAGRQTTVRDARIEQGRDGFSAVVTRRLRSGAVEEEWFAIPAPGYTFVAMEAVDPMGQVVNWLAKLPPAEPEPRRPTASEEQRAVILAENRAASAAAAADRAEAARVAELQRLTLLEEQRAAAAAASSERAAQAAEAERQRTLLLAAQREQADMLRGLQQQQQQHQMSQIVTLLQGLQLPLQQGAQPPAGQPMPPDPQQVGDVSAALLALAAALTPKEGAGASSRRILSVHRAIMGTVC